VQRICDGSVQGGGAYLPANWPLFITMQLPLPYSPAALIPAASTLHMAINYSNAISAHVASQGTR